MVKHKLGRKTLLCHCLLDLLCHGDGIMDVLLAASILTEELGMAIKDQTDKSVVMKVSEGFPSVEIFPAPLGPE